MSTNAAQIEALKKQIAKLEALDAEAPHTFESWAAKHTDAGNWGRDLAIFVPAKTYANAGSTMRLWPVDVRSETFVNSGECPYVMRGSRLGRIKATGRASSFRACSEIAEALFWRVVRRDRRTIFTEAEWNPYRDAVWDRVYTHMKKWRRDCNYNELKQSGSGYVGLDSSDYSPDFLLNGRVKKLAVSPGDQYDERRADLKARVALMLQIHAVDKKLARLPA